MVKPTPRLLIVDDDRDLAGMLLEILELEGYVVDIATDGEAALRQVHELPPDLIILDVMLPGIDGFEVLKRLRKNFDLPVIMLTARGDESERIHGLVSGADDYIPKPFSPIELAARIHNVLRRSTPTGQPLEKLTAGPITLDRKRRKLFLHDTEVKLTAAELRVLEQLMQRSGEVLSRAHLTELALNRPLEAYDRSIDTLISKMRKKLADAGLAGNCIRSLRGHGYVFDVDAETS